MEFRSLLSLPNFLVLFGLVNLLVLLAILRANKRHVRWHRFFQLLMVDLAALYAYISLINIPFERLREDAWLWAIFLSLIVIVLPLIFYRAWLGVASFFLLPIDLKHWRQWSLPARAMATFAGGHNHPYLAYNDETNELEKRLDGNIMYQGSAGIILLRPEHALVIGSGPKVNRVAGGDVIFTGRKERPLHLADLRLHLVVILNAPAVTKDGLGVKHHIFVPCRIDPGGAPGEPERLFPFNPQTVVNVVSQHQDVGDKEKQPWHNLVAQRAQKAARDVIATYVLDRLYTGEEPDQIPRNEVRVRIQERLIAEMVGSGIHILGVGIGNLEPAEMPAEPERKETLAEAPLSVPEQRVASWRAAWQARDRERQARGEAEAIRILEQARAQALTELINTVAEGFRELSASGAAQPSDVVALSFVNAVEQMLTNQSLPEPLDVTETEARFLGLRGIRSRLMLASGTQPIGR